MKKLDMEKVTNGIIREYPVSNSDGTTPFVKISMMGSANMAYQTRLEALMRPHRRRLQLGAIKEEEAQGIFRKAFIEKILLGWGNVQPDDDGNNVPFSSENAETILGDLAYMPFYEWMREEAALEENFLVERRKLDAGN